MLSIERQNRTALARQSDRNTKNTKRASEVDDDLAPRQLDWSKAVRGKHYQRYQEGANLIVLAPDLMDTFPDPESVNTALRSLKELATRATHTA